LYPGKREKELLTYSEEKSRLHKCHGMIFLNSMITDEGTMCSIPSTIKTERNYFSDGFLWGLSAIDFAQRRF